MKHFYTCLQSFHNIGGRGINVFGGKTPEKHSEELHNKQMIINRGIGACYFLTDSFFEHYEQLDDRVFLWGEEALLSHQVEIVDGKILYAPSLVVEHAESGTVKKMLTRDRYERVKQSYKIYREYL